MPVSRGPRTPADREKIREGCRKHRDRVRRALALLALVEGKPDRRPARRAPSAEVAS